MSLTARLRGIVRSGGSAEPTSGAAESAPRLPRVRGPGAAEDSTHRPADPAAALGGEWCEAGGRSYIVVDRTYPPDHRHGHRRVSECAPAGDVCWPALSMLEPGAASRRLIFVDLETTGLAGGAGTYAFLVGCGWFEQGAFRVRQFLLAGYAAEQALLGEVARIACDSGALATYNGKTFDLPLIESRFLLHRMTPPFDDLPHVDMLHPARRLWGESSAESAPHAHRPAPAGGSCRLSVLEQTVLGHQRHGDVPGSEIPSRYFQYVRTGDAQPLQGVLEHNRLDILSLAMLAAYAAGLLEHGADAARTAREALGLGRLYERAGRPAEARRCYARSADIATDPSAAAEALRGDAVLARRAGCHDEAAQAWRRVLDLRTCPPWLRQQASEALAVHHEHRVRDLPAARHFAAASLGWTSGQRAAALQHRLARLDRKLGRVQLSSSAPSAPDPLF